MAITNTMNSYTNGLTSPPALAARAGRGKVLAARATSAAACRERRPNSPPLDGEGDRLARAVRLHAQAAEGIFISRSLRLQAGVHDLAVLGEQRALDDFIVPVDL